MKLAYLKRCIMSRKYRILCFLMHVVIILSFLAFQLTAEIDIGKGGYLSGSSGKPRLNVD